MAEFSKDFEEVYKSHYKMLRSAAHNIIGDHDASHDVVQEVFLKLWNKRNELDYILNIKAYLFKSVVNTSLTYLEHNKNKTSLPELKLESSSASDSKILVKELEEKIQLALDALPPKCKTIFVLSRFQGLKNKEIAEVLGLSLKTVENQMGIALKKMRDDLRPYLTRDFLGILITLGIAYLCT